MKTRFAKRKICNRYSRKRRGAKTGGDFTNVMRNVIIKQITDQNQKAAEMRKTNPKIVIVNTTQLQIGKKYWRVLEGENSSFTLKSKVLDNSQPPAQDPGVKITGPTYKISANEWWITDLAYANDLYVKMPGNTPAKILVKNK